MMSSHATKTIGAARSLALIATNEMTFLEAALHYAAQGISVFPLRVKDKRPLPGSHGCSDASTDQSTIRKWWMENPNANIGIATGAQSGIFVLDVDGDEGFKSLLGLEAENGALPATPVSETGRGKHLLFRDNGGHRNSASSIAPNLDIRADGGYIVAPPSVHPNGHRYMWLKDGALADAPDWFIGRMSPGPTKNNTGRPAIGTEGARILEGSRNSRLTSFAGLLRQKGIDGNQLFELVMTRNLNACDPPLDEGEVKLIVRSINDYRATEKYPLTDYGNAMRFVALHGENLRYVWSEGIWLHWCGSHWKTIHRDAVFKMVFDVPGAILIEAKSAEDEKAATTLRKHALATQARSKLEATLELARPLLTIDGDRLDTDRMMFAVKNGQLDLTTGTLLPHCREDYITKCLYCDYDPIAPRPRWDRFVSEVTCGDTGVWTHNLIQTRAPTMAAAAR
jgi:putative DNA primase/helicase